MTYAVEGPSMTHLSLIKLTTHSSNVIVSGTTTILATLLNCIVFSFLLRNFISEISNWFSLLNFLTNLNEFFFLSKVKFHTNLIKVPVLSFLRWVEPICYFDYTNLMRYEIGLFTFRPRFLFLWMNHLHIVFITQILVL